MSWNSKELPLYLLQGLLLISYNQLLTNDFERAGTKKMLLFINSVTLQKYADLMNTSMMVNGPQQVPEIRERIYPQQPLMIRVIAQAISWIFHPVFVPIYVIYFLAYIHPFVFAGFDNRLKNTAVMGAGFMAFTFFPLVTVLLLKGLKFIDSIYLRTQRDRVIPLIACMIWYFWIAYVWFSFGKTRNAIDMPAEAIVFAIATFASTVIGLMVNIKMKVSLHAISMGIVLAFFIMLALTQPLNFGIWLSVVLFITGMVCTARFIVSDHTATEIYGGLATGIASLLLARLFLNWLT